MVAQKHTQKNCWQKYFAFLNAHYPKTQQIKALNSPDSSRSYRKPLENPKTHSFKKLFLPKNDFKTCSAVNFLKKHPVLEAWKPTKDTKFRLAFFFMCPSTDELNAM